MLADYMLWLASDHGAMEEIGRRAAAHIRGEHALERVGTQYWDTINRSR